MFALALRHFLRRRLRHGLTLAGIAAATAVLVCVIAFGEGYQRSLRHAVDRSGVQMMLVPLGCPYDGAARVLHNHALDQHVPAAAWEIARRDPAVAVAAPMLIADTTRRDARRSDRWVGLDGAALALKPWWNVRSGQRWFGASNEVILGADVAALEMRVPGDKFYSPETHREFRVAGVLARSGTSDDTAVFLPLATAQRVFAQPGQLTAVAIRLKDPALIREAAPRLQKIPGAQVATMTEMMGTFLNLLGMVRTLVLAVTAMAVAVSALTMFNTLFAGVIERTNEFAVMRAVGASRAQIFGLLLGESVLLSLAGAALGIAGAFALGAPIEKLARSWVPLAPAGTLLAIVPGHLLRCGALALAVGAAAAVYPAWRAARLQPALATRIE